MISSAGRDETAKRMC